MDFIDTQRSRSVVASKIRNSDQVNLDKISRGVRPLTMLEESLKVIEGAIASKKNQARTQLPIGTVYPSSNIAGEAEHRAAATVLQIDALVCEDSTKYNKPLCKSPTDYDFFQYH